MHAGRREGEQNMIRLRWAAAAAVLSLATAACGFGGDTADDNGSGSNGSSGSDGNVVYDSQFAPRSAFAVETDDAFLLTNSGSVETLIRYDADGSLQPGLAESWEQTAPTKWTVTLREGVEFQDGTAMTAETVTGALTHVLEAPTPARSFNPDTISKVTAVDDSTVEITTAAPDVLLPYRLASPNTAILAPKAYDGKQIDIVGTGTGAFTVTEVNARQSLKLERNDSYWGDKAQVATAEFRFVVDGDARVTQLQTGEAQIIESIPPAAKANLDGDDSLEVVDLQLPRTTSMIVNTQQAPFDNLEVRQALQTAVDSQAIADSIYEGAAAPAVGPFSPEDAWATPGAQAVTHDDAEATSMLEEAGVSPSDLSFTLIAYNDRPEFGDLAAVIQDELKKIGVDVTIKAGDYASFEPDLLSGNFDAVLLSRGYLTDVGDPAGYLSSDFTCDGGYNIAQWCDPETDAAIQEAVATEDSDARYKMYGEIGASLQEQVAQVFLVNNSAQNAVSADVSGYEVHPLGFYGLTNAISVG
jgi:peptide/nickel transport system substrate-binding protein